MGTALMQKVREMSGDRVHYILVQEPCPVWCDQYSAGQAVDRIRQQPCIITKESDYSAVKQEILWLSELKRKTDEKIMKQVI